jgi:exodeoxyribonuclease V alpha subunit
VTAPLSPRGTLRARITWAARDDMFRRLGVGARTCDLGDEGLYLAEELVAADRWLGGDDAITLGVLVLALMIAQRQGSTRLPLDARGPLRALVADIARLSGDDLDAATVLRAIGKRTASPGFGSVLGAADARLPLVVDDGCLYTERSRWLEERVAIQLAARIAAPARPAAEAARVVAELRAGAASRPLSAEQEAAVALALTGSIAVVTGGPGTGKTLVAAAIVRGLARQGALARGGIALAAQTGKAANRLTQVIGEQLAAAAGAPAAASGGHAADAGTEVDRALAAAPPAAQTLHRLLGYRAGRFAHHAHSPLPIGAVIVDEASMIDLELMDALLDALPASAPLVLVGDAEQLPAIDAGQILADLAAPDGPAIARVAVLSRSYRMDTQDADGRAVYDAAAAINVGAGQRLVDRARALAVPRAPAELTFRGVEWVDPQGGAAPTSAPAASRGGRRAHVSAAARAELEVALAAVEALWRHFDGPALLRAAQRVFRFTGGAVDPGDAPALEALWRGLARARVLTVTRALPTGSIAINAHLHELALAGMTVTGHPELVPGEPVMITANDYHRGLFNGDQGIVVRADEGHGRHHYRAVFRVGGALRPFAVEALRDRLELAWALTVHKSQGSELDAVALVLPHEEIPLVTRELLYTGVTRARTGVAIVGSRHVLVGGAKRRAQRHSGLAARLARATLPR